MHQWQFSTHIISNCPARSCCMHEGRDRNYLMSYKKALCSPLLHISTVRLWFSVYIIKKFATVWCMNGETTIFGLCYKEALCWSLLHVSTSRLQFSVYIIKRFLDRCCCMQQWPDHDFRYILWKSLRSPLLRASMVWPKFSVYIITKLCARHWCLQHWHWDFCI